jgi:hypothetical protein
MKTIIAYKLKSYCSKAMKVSLLAVGLIWMLPIVIGNVCQQLDKMPSVTRMAPASIKPGSPGFIIYALSTGVPAPASSLPILTSLSPDSTMPRSLADLNLSVLGSNFKRNSVVKWNGSNRKTTYVNGNVLQAIIPVTDIGIAGTANVTVYTPEVGSSSPLQFSITAAPSKSPSILLGMISPDCASPGNAGFVLTAMGTHFANNSVIQWNGSKRATTFVKDSQLTAVIPAGDLVTEGTAIVTIYAAGVGSSNSRSFTIGACKSKP